MKKRLLSFCMVLALLLGGAVPAAVADETQETEKYFMRFTEEEAGAEAVFNPIFVILPGYDLQNGRYIAQEFVPDAQKIGGVRLLLNLTDLTATLHVQIATAIEPQKGGVIAQGTAKITSQGNKMAWYTCTFDEVGEVTPGQKYYLIYWGSDVGGVGVNFVTGGVNSAGTVAEGYKIYASFGPDFDPNYDPGFEGAPPAVGTIDYMSTGFEMLEPDPDVMAVMELIKKISDPVTLADEPAVIQAREAFDLLTQEQQNMVSNVQKLTAAEEAIDRLKKEEAVVEVMALIDALPDADDVTLEDEAQIVAAREAFNALSVPNQGKVENIARLTAAEEKLAELKLTADKEENMQKVADMIDAIGTVTKESGEKIIAAEAALEELIEQYGEEEVKAGIDNLDVLTKARKDYDALFEVEQVAYGDVDDSSKVDPVDAMISLQAYAGLTELSETEKTAAEVTGEGQIDPEDAMLILQYYAGYINLFPIERGGFDPQPGSDDWSTEDPHDQIEAIAEQFAQYEGSEYILGGKMKAAQKLYLINAAYLSDAEIALVQSLQGIVAQSGESQIYMQYPDGTELWVKELPKRYGIEYIEVDNVWELVDHFKDHLQNNGYVTYMQYDETMTQTDAQESSINVACTIAGLEKYLIVEESLEQQAQEYGLVKRFDATTMDQFDCWDEYGDRVYKNVLVSLPYTLPRGRDIGIAMGCFFYRENPEWMASTILPTYHENAVIMGWHDAEDIGVMSGTRLGIATIASDHCQNYTVYAGLQKSVFKQTPSARYAVEGDNKHYLTMIYTDGDNIQYIETEFATSKKYWGADSRGTVPMGWSLSPSLTEMSPLFVNYLYNTATVNDHFVGSVSGIGYTYMPFYGADRPDQMACVEEHVRRSAEYAAAMDLSVISIWDWGLTTLTPQKRKEYLNLYTAPSSVKGGLYTFSEHLQNGNKGQIFWSDNGKPFLAYREFLIYQNGQGSQDAFLVQNKYELLARSAHRVNSYSTDPHTIDGYTAVTVHCWDYSYEDMVGYTKLLDDDVVVVTPEEFFDLIVENLPKTDSLTSTLNPDQYDYSGMKLFVSSDDFDSINAELMVATDETLFAFDDIQKGSCGWVPHASINNSYNQTFIQKVSGEDEPYHVGLFLTGTHGGKPELDKTINASAYNKLQLAPTAKNLNITGYGAKADLRVQVVDAAGEVSTVYDWQRQPENGYALKDATTFHVDISEFAGQTVTVYIQFSDAGLNGSAYTITEISIT